MNDNNNEMWIARRYGSRIAWNSNADEQYPIANKESGFFADFFQFEHLFPAFE